MNEPTTIDTIQAQCRDLCNANDRAMKTITEYDEAKKKLDAQFLPRLQRHAETITNAHLGLLENVEAGRALFESPKTQTFFGVRVGWTKGKGSFEFDNAEAVIKRIEKFLADKLDTLVKVTKKLKKAALNDLDGAELKEIGVTVTGSGDAPFVKLQQGGAEKMLAALLNGGRDDE